MSTVSVYISVPSRDSGAPLALGAGRAERDANAGDTKRAGVSSQHADQEPQHAIRRWAFRDGGEQRRLRIPKGAESPCPSGPAEGRRAGGGEGQPGPGGAVTGGEQGET